MGQGYGSYLSHDQSSKPKAGTSDTLSPPKAMFDTDLDVPIAKGYTQTYDIDYQKIFALVAKMNSTRVLLSLAINFDWLLHQFDMKNVFLDGKLEEVYVDLPSSF